MTDVTSVVSSLTSILNGALSVIGQTPNVLNGFNLIAGLFLLGGSLAIQLGTSISNLPVLTTFLNVFGIGDLGETLVFLGNILKVIGSLLSGNVLGAVNSLVGTVGSLSGALPTISLLAKFLTPLGVIIGLLGKLLNKPLVTTLIGKVSSLLGPLGTEIQLLIKLLPTLAAILMLLGSVLQATGGIGAVISPLLNTVMPVLQGLLGTILPSGR